jgi:hypothetical protein
MADQGTKSSSAYHRDLRWKSRPKHKVSIRACRTGDQRDGQHSQSSPHHRNHDRGITTNASAEAEKMPPLPLAKLIVLAGCVSLLAALFLAAPTGFPTKHCPFSSASGNVHGAVYDANLFFSTRGLLDSLPHSKALTL